MYDLTDSYETFVGRKLLNTVQLNIEKPLFGVPGENSSFLPVDNELLSKHVLLAGGIGMGKTNVLNFFVRSIRNVMSDNDVMIIFDSKGDYYKNFYQPGDIVISNDSCATDFWNIFEEVSIDEHIEENIMEIASFLFKDKIDNSSNPFFPSAAKELFSTLLTFLIRNNNLKYQNNEGLRYIIDSFEGKDYINRFKQFIDMQGIISYISDDAKGQAQGVLSEFQQGTRQIFIGNFKKIGHFSIRKAVRNKGKKCIFIEYDLSLGKTLAPIYSLLIDLAIKEALTRKQNEGNVYFILDEFRLLQPLEHMDNGINFGRSLGAKFILGIQNVEQVYNVYGELAGRSILSGCSSLISFFVVDAATRQIIKERGGSCLNKITYMSKVSTRGISEQVINGSTIEDWDISNLSIGEAIVQSANHLPFRFHFKEYK